MKKRNAPIDLSPAEFRKLGHALVDRVADLLENLDSMPVSPGKSVAEIREILGDSDLPSDGSDPHILMKETAEKLFSNSTFNGHPLFLGYITASATPIGILSEMLAATINPNLGGWQLSPMSSEIEVQIIRWLCQMMDLPETAGGLLVSGGNMANFHGFLTARTMQAGAKLRERGLREFPQFVAYTSAETHTWIQKAADLFGIGTDHLRWIPTDENLSMDLEELEKAIVKDRKDGLTPFMVIGTAGSVSTGAIDPLGEIADICEREDLWFHVDGAYGAFAKLANSVRERFNGIERANSIALDPHKWLYSPLEAGCFLVQDKQHLIETFSYRPPYYHFSEGDELPETNFYELGLQNSRGFKALKVWMAIKHVGLSGYSRMIEEDIRLARLLFDCVDVHDELEAKTCDLSITTFRYKPADSADIDLNQFNSELLEILKNEGKVFLSNAVIDGDFFLRGCIVNFRTSEEHIRRIPEIVVEAGSRLLASSKA